jgi:hypothetical protein
LPSARLADVKEGGETLPSAVGLTGPRQDGADVVLEAGSGSYRFGYALAK